MLSDSRRNPEKLAPAEEKRSRPCRAHPAGRRPGAVTPEKAYEFARQRTIVRTRDFTAIGIPRHYLAWMCEEGWLVKEGYGLYRAAERKAAR
ncbi:type IV toxin-antitoxin system AbiEi family antitoxin domain-containing protein [Corticibacterium sp. UT-5YL-CI-8]|nr:type IV toxin-antitoxin system AbiEi family antitoxin domain-containing protein [Tianweitania sp. UT-5YL-CI-8]